ncbi:MAG: ABC transporter substrate-binding protein [Peptoniphilaceae bacterium]|nr:ABC transporter substrate-binding protein [Peptoniphilaceae bacterium]MDY6085438.1 ABC transporter substrate-binding protein [Peptoniphilaceae bacterium]
MKKFRKLAMLLFLAVGLAGCASQGEEASSAQNVVNVYNWGEYIDPELVDRFEQETGIDVIYSNYATNEDMYVKLKNGGATYDVVVPSEYMLQRMIQEDMVLPIDFGNIPNMENVDAAFQHMAYDPEQKYSVPYFWGTVGILYNKTMVDDPVESWDILWNPKYARQIIMLDSSRDSLMVGLARQGYSVNTQNLEELTAARDDLIRQYPLVYAYLVDETRDLMINGENAMAIMYSGDAYAAMSENEDLDYVVPPEGGNLWFDVFAIPKGAKHKENAEKFINFMLQSDVMAQNAEWVGYSLPSQVGRELLPDEMKNSPVAYPDPAVYAKAEVFTYLGDFVEVYDQMWQDVKNQ